MFTQDIVWDRVVLQSNWGHILFGLFSSLANTFWNFLCLAVTDPDIPCLVTYNNQSRKAEATTAGNNLGTTVDVNNLFKKTALLFLALLGTKT
jgi:hypothetical protein